MRKNKINDVELLLSKFDRDELCAFIRIECAKDKQLCGRFLAMGAGTVFSTKASDYKSTVRDIIEDFEGRYGYVEYRDTFALNLAICEIIDEAEVAMADQKWKLALTVLEGVADAGDDIINCGDDSAGELGNIVSECFEKWYELCGVESLPPKIKSEIFEHAIAYFTKGHLKSYDWWWDWIEMAISLADTSERQERVVKALDDVINAKVKGDWSSEYNSHTAQKYKLDIMSKRGTPEEQRRFMYENADNPDFRKRLLQMAWDEGDYDEALRLAKDGVEHDSELLGLVNDWHEWEFKVYRHNDDKANTLKLSRYFFFTGRRFSEGEYSMPSMYALMKSLVPSSDWDGFAESLLKDASRDLSRRLFIYTQEKMWDRYMDYLRKSPSTSDIDDAPQEIWTLYKDELIRLYALCIRKFFQCASGRDAYRDGVNQLRKLIRYGGKAESDAIVVEQKARSPRRPALVDELSKL